MRSLRCALVGVLFLIVALPAAAAPSSPPEMSRNPGFARPLPPPELADPERCPEMFRPAPELVDWLRAVFLDPDGPLFNEEHLHLVDAEIGALWTNAHEKQKGIAVAATAEMPNVAGSRWCKARARVQLTDWFGERATLSGHPDFVLTFDAVYAALTPDLAWCARVEHELYHCGQLEDEHGEPRYTPNGDPIFAIKAHDVEEFVGVVERYGTTGRNVKRLVDAANRGPFHAPAEIGVACGTCGRRVT